MEAAISYDAAENDVEAIKLTIMALAVLLEVCGRGPAKPAKLKLVYLQQQKRQTVNEEESRQTIAFTNGRNSPSRSRCTYR